MLCGAAKDPHSDHIEHSFIIRGVNKVGSVAAVTSAIYSMAVSARNAQRNLLWQPYAEHTKGTYIDTRDSKCEA